MSFTQIITNEHGKSIANDVQVPGDVRLSEEERTTAIMEEKNRTRAMYQELTPVKNSEHAPHPKREESGADLPEQGKATTKNRGSSNG